MYDKLCMHAATTICIVQTSIIALTESPHGSKLLTSNTAFGTISSILLSYTLSSETIKIKTVRKKETS